MARRCAEKCRAAPARGSEWVATGQSDGQTPVGPRQHSEHGRRAREESHGRSGMEAAHRAARIVRTVIETLKPGFAVKLCHWPGAHYQRPGHRLAGDTPALLLDADRDGDFQDHRRGSRIAVRFLRPAFEWQAQDEAQVAAEAGSPARLANRAVFEKTDDGPTFPGTTPSSVGRTGKRSSITTIFRTPSTGSSLMNHGL